MGYFVISLEDSEAPEALTAGGLETELQLAMDCGMAGWLAEAVVEACCNGDLIYLQRQVERHIHGWTRP